MRRTALVVAPLVLAGCNQEDTKARNAAAAEPQRSESAAAAASAATPVRTASRPADDCGWISAADVAAIVGPLTGPPRPSDEGCVYPLPLDSATARRRALAEKLSKKLEEKFGPSDLPKPEPDESAVIIVVEVKVDPAMDRAVGAGVDKFTREALGDATVRGGEDSARRERPFPPGWDGPMRYPATFGGRVGHIGVAVRVQAAAVSRDQAAALAASVRDRIPDLPFAWSSGGSAGRAGVGGEERDPCRLITAQEAEAVLGKLIVPPYRSHDGTPLAEAGGKSCAYYTAGHHALVLTPTWSYGGSDVEVRRMVGGIMGKVIPQGSQGVADTLDGDWDDVGNDPATGELYFLKGDRLLAIGYMASSTDANGAVRLAQLASARLGDGANEAGVAPRPAAKSSRCPSAADVGTELGNTTRVVRVDDSGPDWVTCNYELMGRYRGVFLELKTEPASRAEIRFEELRQNVKRAAGPNAEPDRIAVGEGGWAYGSGAFSQAAAVVGDHFHRAKMEYFAYPSIGDQRDAMVRLLKLMAR
jgi:hypothetical protein